MELILAALFAYPVAALAASLSFAMALLALLSTFSFFDGLYYSAPRMLVRWFLSRALQSM